MLYRRRPYATTHACSSDSAVTKSVPSSGRLSQTSTALIAMASTRATTTSSSSVSTFTTTKLARTSTFPALSWSISSPVPWTLYGLVPSATCSDRTTSSSARAVLETTGRKDVSRALLSFPATLSWCWRLKRQARVALQRVVALLSLHSFKDHSHIVSHLDYTEGAELVDSVLDVVRKEAEGTDCLQGTLKFLVVTVT